LWINGASAKRMHSVRTREGAFDGVKPSRLEVALTRLFMRPRACRASGTCGVDVARAGYVPIGGSAIPTGNSR